MGIALNISQRGILIETPGVVESEYIRLITIGLNNDLMEIKGKITYCNEIGAGKYRTGIQFQGSPAQSIEFAKALIRSYHVKKQKYRYKGYKGYE